MQNDGYEAAKSAADLAEVAATNGAPRLPYRTHTPDSNSSMVACPTCNGSGQVPREDNDLVALIPLSDKRLRPSRTRWYVAATVVICIVAFALCLFFLMPRNVTLSSSSPRLLPLDVYLHKGALNRFSPNSIVRILVTNVFNVTNSNFYPVTISNITLEAFRLARNVGLMYNQTQLSVASLSSRTVYVTMNLTVEDDFYFYLRCAEGVFEMADTEITFQATTAFSSMWLAEQTNLRTTQIVYCQVSRPSTVAPPTTTTPPPSTTTQPAPPH